MKTFKVVAQRWAHGWELHIEGVGVTQVRKVKDAEAMVRDYLRLDGVTGDFRVDIDFRADEDTDAKIQEARRADEEATQAQARAAAMKREIAQRLRQRKYQGTEIAAVLGVSTQRASQLLQAHKPAKKPTQRRRASQPLDPAASKRRQVS